MKLFPLGELSTTTSYGSIDSVSYKLFEPNNGCHSVPVYSVLTSMWDNQVMTTRKKADPYILIKYDYENIVDKEYKEIEHFVENVGEALNPFYAVAWDRGITPTSVSGTTTYTVSIPVTRYYSTIANYKAHYAILWNGNKFMIGDVTTVNANTSIVIDTDYGDLSAADANIDAILYPLYEVFLSPNALQNFDKTYYAPEDINPTHYGGYMRSGSISFVGKYKV